MLLAVPNQEAKGQTKTYLTGQKTGNYFGGGAAISLGPGNATVSTPMSSHSTTNFLGVGTTFRYFYGTTAILTGSTSTPVKVRAAQDLGLLGVLGAGADAYLQIRNTTNTDLTGGTTTYLRIDKPTLSGISVAVGGLLGLVELQSVKGVGYSGANDYILNTANTSGGAAYNGNERNGSAVSSTSKLLLDQSANWYLAVTPSASYNAVRVEVALPSDLRVADIARNLETNVYHAFTQTDGGVCNLSPQFTSPGEVLGGITLNGGVVGGLELSQLVANPQLAINGNSGDYSSFSSGLLSVGVANSVAQSFYFDHKATVNDGIRLQLGLQGSLIDVGLLKMATVKFNAYNGTSTTPVYQSSLSDLATLLQLNVLNLVTINGSPSHKKLDFIFKPGVQFDRLEIVFDQGVAAIGVLGDALRIYEVNLAPSPPNITLQPTNANASNICEGGAASFTMSATASSGGVINGYQWQYLNTADSTWVDAPSGTGTTLNISAVTNAMNNRWYRTKVTGGNASCPQDVFTKEVQLTVTPRALASDIVSLGTNICPGVATNLSASSITVSSPSFKWYSNAALTGSPLSTTNQLNVSPSTTTSYWVTVQGTGKCENAPNTAKEVVVTVKPLQTAPVLTISSN